MRHCIDAFKTNFDLTTERSLYLYYPVRKAKDRPKINKKTGIFNSDNDGDSGKGENI
jgi:hypothetical protein